ncbi:hypothetical protein SCHPADRAFT_744584 [Schizopora paradoxa]|uniref:Uncharacterized protein n=1 Tax=Schizopora paradoxa TaxID=27342 RepID=A0A0H2R0N3_9AGAM|nr:hypothetical protein SCHPADRAFT_744584 [Schizopora paradoxa]
MMSSPLVISKSVYGFRMGNTTTPPKRRCDTAARAQVRMNRSVNARLPLLRLGIVPELRFKNCQWCSTRLG